MKRVINFSGGKTSAYMTIKEYKEGDIVLFCDTGREHKNTYNFIENFEKNENIPIIKIGNKNSFDEFLKKRNYDFIPNRVKRACTIELKIKPARRYLRSINLIKYENLIGFRYDEEFRVKKHKEKWKKVKTVFPLYDNKITKQEIEDFWNKKNYNLELPKILGNCTLCFMKGKNAILAIMREYPELAKEWIEDEQKCKYKHTYLNGISYKELLNIAQNNLFKNYNLDEINSAYTCNCTNF